MSVNARFLVKVGNTPAGTVRELDDDHPALRGGQAVPVGDKAAAGVSDPDPADVPSEFDVATASVPEMREEAKRRGVDSTGKKADLVARLAPTPLNHDNVGGEEPGEGVDVFEQTNVNLTDNDGHDEIITEDHFLGESNTDEPGIKIASTADFAGESDPSQDVPDPTPSAPADDDEF